MDKLQKRLNSLKNDVIFIAYYTVGTPYRDQAIELVKTLEQFDLRYELEGVPNLGTWQKNTQFKAVFCQSMMLRYPHNKLVYLDSDARIRSYPELFDQLSDCDLGVHYRDGWELLASTIFFAPTQTTKDLIEEWIAENTRKPNRQYADQKNLQDVVARIKPRICKLPPSYALIFDKMRKYGAPVIEQMQASRKLRKSVNANT